MENELDMTTTQELPICEAPIHALAAIAFWERTATLAAHTEVDRRVAVQASFDEAMGHPLTFLDSMLAVRR